MDGWIDGYSSIIIIIISSSSIRSSIRQTLDTLPLSKSISIIVVLSVEVSVVSALASSASFDSA